MIKPPLNITKLPPVFDLPRSTNYIPKPKATNLQVIHYPRITLDPLPNKPIFINNNHPLPPNPTKTIYPNKSTSTSTTWSKGTNNGRRPLLKPLELKNKNFQLQRQKQNQTILEETSPHFSLFPNINISSERGVIPNDNNNLNATKLANINQVSNMKGNQDIFSKTSLLYASTMITKMHNDIGKCDMSKMDKCIKDKTITSNMNMNINVNTSMNYLNISNTFIDKYNPTFDEFIYIDKHKKKALHMPTLQVYNVLHINTELYEKQITFISNWNKMEHSTCEIVLQYKNNNDNCYDLFIEKPENGSLYNVLKCVGSINENILRQLTRQFILIIPYLEKKMTDIPWNDMEMYSLLKEENICFDYKNNIKLFPSILRQQQQQHNIQSKRSKDMAMFDKNIEMFINNNTNTNVIKENLFYFYYGVTLLNAHLNIYNLSIYDVCKEFPHEQMKNCCCLYHFIINNNTLASQYINESFFSNEYLTFLHVVTSFKFNCVSDVVSKSKWIAMNTLIPSPTLTDLVNVGKLYDYDAIYYESINNIINFDALCYNIKKELPKCVDYFNYFSINHHHFIFSSFRLDMNELARELRMDVDTVETNLVKIYQNYFDQKINK